MKNRYESILAFNSNKTVKMLGKSQQKLSTSLFYETSNVNKLNSTLTQYCSIRKLSQKQKNTLSRSNFLKNHEHLDNTQKLHQTMKQLPFNDLKQLILNKIGRIKAQKSQKSKKNLIKKKNYQRKNIKTQASETVLDNIPIIPRERLFQKSNGLFVISKQIAIPLSKKKSKRMNEYEVNLKDRPVSALYKSQFDMLISQKTLSQPTYTPYKSMNANVFKFIKNKRVISNKEIDLDNQDSKDFQFNGWQTKEDDTDYDNLMARQSNLRKKASLNMIKR